METDADVFLVSAEEAHREFLQEIAKKQGNYVRSASEVPEVQKCVSAGTFERWKVFEKEYKARVAENGGPVTYVADISQNKEFRARRGSVLPAATTSSDFYSFSAQRFFLPEDLRASQGWPSNECPEYGDLLPFEHKALSTNEQRLLMGNGMHLSQVGSIMTYLMSNLMTKSDALALWPIPRPIIPLLPESETGQEQEVL